MKLNEIVLGIQKINVSGDDKIDIKDIVFDSAKAKSGSCFICLVGKNIDGHYYADLAVAKGAVAVVCMHEYHNPSITVVRVDDTRKALSIMASNFYGRPSDSLKLITVVGTNGKSTTAYIVHKLLTAEGYNCGLIGTMYYEYNNFRITSNMTTPDPMDLQKLFADMVACGVEYVVMELSAHAIYLDKLFGMTSEMTIFTNLSQDHLDFFGNMVEYKECKKSYFDKKYTKLAIVNADDECGREILNESNVPMISYGIDNPADVFAIDEKYGKNSTSYIVNALDDIFAVETTLQGKFNIYNTISACICVKTIGVNSDGITRTLRSITPPSGRFNVFHYKDAVFVIDFAHTPDGLYNLLKEGRKLTDKRLITIFGCGGDRDILKRPIMGKIASEMSDIVIVTSDNPRTESRIAIADDIIAGMKLKGKLYVELDRAKAISLGADLAQKGDVVLIAGKGSENYIDENNQKIPYSDMAQLLRVMGQTDEL